jgi:uncharacterized protein involved in exopolysaccharide biosynthesis
MRLPNTLGAEYIRIVLSRWKLVLALIGLSLLAAFGVTLYMMQKPTFEASSRLNIVPTSEELGYASRFVRGTTFDGGSTLLATYAEFAHTRPVVAPIVDRWIAEQAKAAGQTVQQWTAANTPAPGFSPRALYSELNYGTAPVQPLRNDLIDGVIKYTTIETVEGTYLMKLTVEWDDPQAAAWFANALADAIIARAERMSSKSGTEIAGNLQTRLAEKQAELDATLRRSRDMKQSVGVVDVDQQKQALLAAQVAEQSQLTSDRAQLQSSESQVAGLRRQASGKMSTAQAAIDQTLAVEGPKAAGLARGIAIREGRVAQLRAQIAGLGRNEDTIKSLDDRANQLRTEVAALTERVGFAQTENLANAPRIQLIERAVPPLTRSSPKLLLNLALGFVAGCALAGCALLLLGPAPAKARDVADEGVQPVAEPVAPPTSDVPHPRRRWTDFVPNGMANVVEMPRPYPASSPVFATSGSLALARDAAEPEVGSEPVVMAAPQPQAAADVETSPAVAEAQVPEAALPDADVRRDGEAVGEQVVVREGAGEPELVEGEDTSPSDEPVQAADRVFGYLLPPPRSGRRYEAREVQGIGAQVASWLGGALESDAPLTVAAVDDEDGAQRLYQLLHDYLAAHGREVVIVDFSNGARALPRSAGKPLIYAGGHFAEHPRAHRDGAVVVAVAADEGDALEAEARRLLIAAGRPVHVVPLDG